MNSLSSRIVRTVILTIFCAIWIAPLLYTLRVALAAPIFAQSGTPPLFAAITFENFAGVLANREFMLALLNSLIIGVASTALILVIAVPAAFVCATFEFRGREKLEAWILSTRMLPAFVVVLPYFIFFRQLQLLDTMIVLIVMHTVVSLALAFFMLRSFFADIPRETLEAAQLEGAGHFLTLMRVALPQVKGGLIATGILVFIFSWNELAFSFTLAGGAVKTGPVAILGFIAFQNVQVAGLMAAANLLIAPIAILLIVAQKGLIRGLSFGAIKA
jgi:ABC-type glycerol-3-phosphate transport system permease component